MSGTTEGGLKVAKTVRRLYGNDYYARIGRIGGKKGTTGGFWHRKHVLRDVGFIRRAGEKGGAISRRGPKV